MLRKMSIFFSDTADQWVYSIHLFFWHTESCSGMLFWNGRREYFITCTLFWSDVLNGAISEHYSSQYQNESKLKANISFLNLYHTIVSFKDSEKYAFENTVGKIENGVK